MPIAKRRRLDLVDTANGLGRAGSANCGPLRRLYPGDCVTAFVVRAKGGKLRDEKALEPACT